MEKVRLGELLSDTVFTDGDWIESKDQDPKGTIRLIQLADIGDGYFIDKSNRYINKETSIRLRCTFLKEGDLLVARMPDPIGRCCVFPKCEDESNITAVDVCIMRPNSKVFNKYLMYFINSTNTRNLIKSQITGTTRQRITRKKLGELEIPLPPLEEQKRIATLLDTADSLRQKDKALLQKYDALAQSLFLELFGDPVRNEKGWEKSELGIYCEKVQIGPFGSQLHLSDYVETGIPLVNPTNVKKGKIDYFSCVKISKEKYESLPNYHLKVGDLIMARRGDLSKMGIIDKEESFCGTGSLFLRFSDKINSVFGFFLLAHPSSVAMLYEQSQGVTMANLNKSIIKKMNILIPPIELQNQFAEQIQLIEKQKALVEENLAKSEALFMGLLGESFEVI